MNSKIFKIKYSLVIKTINAERPAIFWVVRPSDSQYQAVKLLEFNINPISIRQDEQENQLNYFKISGDKIELIFELLIDLAKGDDQPLPNTVNKERYLKKEKYLEHTPEIIAMVKQVIKNEKSDADKARKIFDFVVKNFKYQYPVPKRGVANLDLQNLKGDCGEYASLFVAMCRIAGIPARNQTGFVIFPDNKNIQEHAWANIFLENLDWVDADPQYASLEESFGKGEEIYFGRRSDYRINFTNGYNIKLKPCDNAPRGEDKDSILVSDCKVQCLQPTVILDQNIKSYQEKIELV